MHGAVWRQQSAVCLPRCAFERDVHFWWIPAGHSTIPFEYRSSPSAPCPDRLPFLPLDQAPSPFCPTTTSWCSGWSGSGASWASTRGSGECRGQGAVLVGRRLGPAAPLACRLRFLAWHRLFDWQAKLAKRCCVKAEPAQPPETRLAPPTAAPAQGATAWSAAFS